MRSELVNDLVVREMLVQPWRLLVEQQGRAGPRLRVYVEGVQWALGPPVNQSKESYAIASDVPAQRVLLFGT